MGAFISLLAKVLPYQLLLEEINGLALGPHYRARPVCNSLICARVTREQDASVSILCQYPSFDSKSHQEEVNRGQVQRSGANSM